MPSMAAWRIAVRICRSIKAAVTRARNWQQKIAPIRAGSRSQSGSESWTDLSRWWRREVGLVAVGGQHLRVGHLLVVGDQREAAVACGAVGDHVVAAASREAVAGADGTPVAGARAGPAASFLPEVLLGG